MFRGVYGVRGGTSGAGWNAGQLFTGWRGYFTGSAVHITKSDLVPLTIR